MYSDPHDPRLLEKRREHYRNNKEQYFERNAEKKRRMQEKLNEIKDVPCMDCGIKYPPHVMDLDHRDPSTKIDTLHRIICQGSWKKFWAEIEKCDVVCANCHRIRTHGRDKCYGSTPSSNLGSAGSTPASRAQ